MSNDYFVEMTKEEDELYHHGILGQKWGIRRYQNPDGTLTTAGRKRLAKNEYEISMINAERNYRINRTASNNSADRYSAKVTRNKELADAYSKYRNENYLIKKEKSDSKKTKKDESQSKKDYEKEKKALQNQQAQNKKQQRKDFVKAALLTIAPVAIAKYIDYKITDKQMSFYNKIENESVSSIKSNRQVKKLAKQEAKKAKQEEIKEEREKIKETKQDEKKIKSLQKQIKDLEDSISQISLEEARATSSKNARSWTTALSSLLPDNISKYSGL